MVTASGRVVLRHGGHGGPVVVRGCAGVLGRFVVGFVRFVVSFLRGVLGLVVSLQLGVVGSRDLDGVLDALRIVDLGLVVRCGDRTDHGAAGHQDPGGQQSGLGGDGVLHEGLSLVGRRPRPQGGKRPRRVGGYGSAAIGL